APDGKTLALAPTDLSQGSNQLIKIVDTSTGQEIRTLTLSLKEFSAVQILAFSPSGKTLACAHDTWISIWKVSTGEKLGGIGNRPGEDVGLFNGITFSADGRMLAAASATGLVYQWNLQTGVQLQPLREPAVRCWCVAYSPDGKTLAAGY